MLETTSAVEDRTVGQLVQALQDGSEDAATRLYEELKPMVYAIVRYRGVPPSDADDVTQQVFITAFRKISQLREVESFLAWLKRIAIRLTINHGIRSKKLYAGMEDRILPNLADHRTDVLTGVDAMIAAETAACVYDLVQYSMNELDRLIILAFYFEGMSINEMSQRFQSPVGTIKRRLHTARQRLREKLEELL